MLSLLDLLIDNKSSVSALPAPLPIPFNVESAVAHPASIADKVLASAKPQLL